jgi:hypothetical protein
MFAEPVISLREVARRLPKVLKLPNKTAASRLLSLLKSGDLEAGFQFPGRATRWIPISTRYWVGIGTDKIQSLVHERGNKKRSGTYKVRISEFGDELVRAVKQGLDQDRTGNQSDTLASAILDEVQRALSVASDRYEVCITEDAWNDYLRRHNLEEPAPYIRRKGGRKEKPSWRELSIIIGAYLLKHNAVTQEEMKLEHAAQNIHKIALERGISELPAWQTIKDHLSQIRSEVDLLPMK